MIAKQILNKLVCFFLGHKLLINMPASPFTAGISKMLAYSKCTRCGKAGDAI